MVPVFLFDVRHGQLVIRRTQVRAVFYRLTELFGDVRGAYVKATNAENVPVIEPPV